MSEKFVPPPQCFPLVRDGRVIGNISVGGSVLWIVFPERTYAFEMHNWFGPIPVNKKTEEELKNGWPDKVWDAWYRWDAGGRLVDGRVCVVPKPCGMCCGKGYVTTGETYRRQPVVADCSRCHGKKIEVAE